MIPPAPFPYTGKWRDLPTDDKTTLKLKKIYRAKVSRWLNYFGLGKAIAALIQFDKEALTCETIQETLLLSASFFSVRYVLLYVISLNLWQWLYLLYKKHLFTMFHHNMNRGS